MKRRVIIDLITEVEENESPSLLYEDIRQELRCCWHNVSFTMKHEDIAEQTEPKCDIARMGGAFMAKACPDCDVEDCKYKPSTDCGWK